MKSKKREYCSQDLFLKRESSTMVWEKKQREQLILLSVAYAFCIVGFFSLLMQSMKESNVHV